MLQLCGGDHSAGYGGCHVRKNAVKVQNVRMEEGITYAEALKKVNQIPKVIETRNATVQSKQLRKEQSKGKNGVMDDKVSFVAFIAEVVNCSAQWLLKVNIFYHRKKLHFKMY